MPTMYVFGKIIKNTIIFQLKIVIFASIKSVVYCMDVLTTVKHGDDKLLDEHFPLNKKSRKQVLGYQA